MIVVGILLAADAARLGGRQEAAASVRVTSGDSGFGNARPTEPGATGPYGRAYTVSEHSPPHCVDDTCVHWVDSTSHAPDLTDANDDGVPDAVDLVVQEVERTARHQTRASPLGLGWRGPMSDGDRGGGSQTDVYLMNLGPGTLGVAPSDADLCTSTCPGYLVLNKELAGDSLREIAAHEYNHVLSYTLDPGAETWLFEATATWMSDRANDDVRTWIRFVERWAGQTEQSMVSMDPLKMYGSAVWLQWLDGRYGPELIRELWERAPGSDGYGGLPLATLDELVRRRGGRGFADDFASFAFALPEWRLPGSGFEDGPAFPDVERVSRLDPATPTAQLSLKPSAFALVDVAPTDAATVTVTVRYPAGERGAIALVARRDDASGEGGLVVRRAEVDGGSAAVTIEDPARFDRITAVAVNPKVPARGSLWPADVSLSAAYSAREVEPPVGEPPTPQTPEAAPPTSSTPVPAVTAKPSEAPIGGTDRRAPRLRLSSVRLERRPRRPTTLRLRVQLDEPATLRLRLLADGASARALGLQPGAAFLERRLRLAPGASERLETLSAGARGRLGKLSRRRAAKLRFRLEAIAADGAGNRAVVRRRVAPAGPLR